MSEADDTAWSDSAVKKRLEAARGYAELGLPELGWEEIEPLRSQWGSRPEFTETELLLLLQERRWDEGFRVAADLQQRTPQHPAGWLQAAFCLHELGRTKEALQTLTGAPRPLREEALFHYNCACYLAVLEQPREAMIALRKAFELDPSYRDNAKADPDLASLRDQL